jgi:hypothetical protein
VPSILDSVKNAVSTGEADLRKAAPDLLAKLGVNQSDEKEVVHGVLLYLVNAIESLGTAELKNLGL